MYTLKKNGKQVAKGDTLRVSVGDEFHSEISKVEKGASIGIASGEAWYGTAAVAEVVGEGEFIINGDRYELTEA